MGVGAAIAVTAAFVPRVQRFDTDLYLSLMGTAVYIEGLRDEESA